MFAESGKEFVDVLLSFLTLPLGTIVRLLGKKSSLGCFDELYKSVESLDESHFHTKACKNMLLHPLSGDGRRLQEDLVVRIDETSHRNIWVCRHQECFRDTFYYSSVEDLPCGQCGKSMDHLWAWTESGGEAGDDGVFVRGGMNYVTTDNLQVVPANTDNLVCLLRDLGCENVNMLEEQTIEIGLDEVKNLLKRSLVSDQPLTGLFFSQSDEPTRTNELSFTSAKVGPQNDPSSESSVNKVKLLVSQTNQSVIHAEVGEEFCNILFGFLTIPLGHVIKLLGALFLSICCIDNLYKSVEHSLMNDFIKSDQCRNMVLSPKLAPFFGSNHILGTEEVLPTVSSIPCCSSCIKNCSPFNIEKMKCSHGNTKVLAVNPKFPTITTETGGSFAKGPCKFLVTDELGVVPFSLISSLRAMKLKEHLASKLVPTKFTFTEAEVLNLLKAALVSHEALTLACMPNKQKRRAHPHY